MIESSFMLRGHNKIPKHVYKWFKYLILYPLGFILGLGLTLIITGIQFEISLLFWIAYPVICILALGQWIREKIKKKQLEGGSDEGI